MYPKGYDETSGWVGYNINKKNLDDTFSRLSIGNI